MKFSVAAILAAALIAPVLAQPVIAFAEEDVAGSADHPLIGRFEGGWIRAYETQEFDGVAIARAPGAVEMVEGAVTRLSYGYPEGVSLTHVARNFEIALEEKGFEILLSCETKACGGVNYDVEQFGNSPSWADRFNYFYVAGVRTGAEGVAHASLFLSENNGRALSVVAVVEEEAMSIRMIDAGEMQAKIAETGRVALYGLQFDTDEATIKPESEPTLAEMAAFLSANPSLDVVIVGHTDNQGSMDYNLALSQRRAQAVRDSLVATYGVAAERIEFAGAGFLAPVAPNTTEQGRALNRRVEIIAR